jgi:hypothetical protein
MTLRRTGNLNLLAKNQVDQKSGAIHNSPCYEKHHFISRIGSGFGHFWCGES